MKKLLVIDDDKATRILIVEFLEGANVTIIECEQGKEAIGFYQEYLNEIALVLLDIKLPDCKGWDLCKQLQAMNNRVPIIALSAIMPAELKRNYKAAGFTNYISKPININEFIELVSNYL